MTNDNQSDCFVLSASEKQISDLYQQSNKQGGKHGGEKPSAELDDKIMKMAQNRLLEKLKKQSIQSEDKAASQILNSSSSVVYAHGKKKWQWPYSLVASFGVLAVLFLTQREHFIQPNHILPKETDIAMEPVMSTADSDSAEEPEQHKVVARTLQAPRAPRPLPMSTEKNTSLSDETFTVASRAKVPPKEMAIMSKSQASDSLTYSVTTTRHSPVSLSAIDKLADQLKAELALQEASKMKGSQSTSTLKNKLFTALLDYKQKHREFEISKDYLSMLTEKQQQSLKALEGVDMPKSHE